MTKVQESRQQGQEAERLQEQSSTGGEGCQFIKCWVPIGSARLENEIELDSHVSLQMLLSYFLGLRIITWSIIRIYRCCKSCKSEDERASLERLSLWIESLNLHVCFNVFGCQTISVQDARTVMPMASSK